MNPLLFANLGTQRRLLQSGTAYGVERILVNVLFASTGVGGLLGVVVALKLGGAYAEMPGVPEGVILSYRVLPVLCALVGTFMSVVGWALIRVFLDMADASIAITLHGPEERALPATPAGGPRGGSGNWPEPPKPLIPSAEEASPEERNYMPGGR